MSQRIPDRLGPVAAQVMLNLAEAHKLLDDADAQAILDRKEAIEEEFRAFVMANVPVIERR